MNLKGISTLVYLLIIACSACKEPEPISAVKLQGLAFGTTYNITYYHGQQTDFTSSIDSLFYLINTSMSTYIANSDISKINGGDTTVVVDTFFKEVFQKSLKVYNETDGVFDPTIGLLVNAWGFGPEKSLKNLDSSKVERLLNLVGFDKVKLYEGRILKRNDSIYFDFNAIAKGFAVDIAGRFLEAKGIDNYLIEIGGELRARGFNQTKSKSWKVGIENPNFDGTRSIEKVIELKSESMATSGNYRKFKMDSITGERFAHIINTKTGYPMKSNVLSVSVIANLDCADVDAYATAIMSMPLEAAKKFLESKQQLKAFIIYSDENGEMKNFITSNF